MLSVVSRLLPTLVLPVVCNTLMLVASVVVLLVLVIIVGVGYVCTGVGGRIMLMVLVFGYGVTGVHCVVVDASGVAGVVLAFVCMLLLVRPIPSVIVRDVVYNCDDGGSDGRGDGCIACMRVVHAVNLSLLLFLQSLLSMLFVLCVLSAMLLSVILMLFT